ncbi:MAG: R2-like ligand-binding oxidase [Candidatus Dormibacteria bacterium]
MMNGSTRTGYQTTSARGLAFDSVPMRLFQKAKRLGTWDPQAVDLTADHASWNSIDAADQHFLLRLMTLFMGGEEAVTLDLLPLVQAVARGGHLEEEIYLTSFLWEEAKHVEWFRRYTSEVCRVDYDLAPMLTPNWCRIFFEELPGAMHRLNSDHGAAAQVRAAVTYNMIVEGVLAETGYYAVRTSLERNGLLPGFVAGMKLVQRDESRHIRYGVYLLQRLIAEDPSTWDVMTARMNELLPHALGLIPEFWEAEGYGDQDEGPFGTSMNDFVLFASGQFDKRMRVLERDRGKTIAEIDRAVQADIESEELEAAAV